VDDVNHVIVINEWSHGFAIQRLLEPNTGTNSASLLINGRSQPKVRRDSTRDSFDTALGCFAKPVMLNTVLDRFN
jgi:hypothetical protein